MPAPGGRVARRLGRAVKGGSHLEFLSPLPETRDAFHEHREAQPGPSDAEQDPEHRPEGFEVPDDGDQTTQSCKGERQSAPDRQRPVPPDPDAEQDGPGGRDEQPESEGAVRRSRHDVDVVYPEPELAHVASHDQEKAEEGHVVTHPLQPPGAARD
jgi:hypothetical protein